ncbi:MAG: hypothetical protein L0Z50_37760 [Verrucomicrobiales bacterium]|nr:hypothetical protein [Verrucomicrobiales bacterium]
MWAVDSGQAVSPEFTLDGGILKRPLSPPFAISPDGRWFGTAGSSGVMIREFPSGAVVTGPLDAGRRVYHAAFSPDSRRLVTACDGASSVWTLDGPEPTRRALAAPSDSRAVAFAHDGTRIAAVDRNGVIRLWEGATGQSLTTKGGLRAFQCVWSENDQFLLTADYLGRAQVWNSADASPAAPPLQHDNVLVADFSADGSKVMTAGLDGTARVWSTRTGEPLAPKLRHGGPLLHAAFNPAGDLLATACQDGTARIWKVEVSALTGRSLAHRGEIESCVYSSDGRWLATSCKDRLARVWDVPSGRLMHEWSHPAETWHAVFSPDDRRLAVIGHEGTVWLHALTEAIPAVPSVSIGARANWAAFSPNGRWLAVGGTDQNRVDGTVQILDGLTLQRVHSLPHPRSVNYVEFDPASQRVLGSCHDIAARLWDVATGQAVGEVRQPEARIRAARFSPNGRWISADCTTVGAYAPQAAKLWDARTCERLPQTFGHRDGIILAVFSPDSRFLATGGEDNMVRVWELPRGGLRYPPLPQSGRPWRLVFSSDGRMMAIAARTGAVRVWDVESGAPVTLPVRVGGGTKDLCFRPDGRQIAVACLDQTVRLIPIEKTGLPLDQLELQARLLTGHRQAPSGLLPLSREELRQLWKASRNRR